MSYKSQILLYRQHCPGSNSHTAPYYMTLSFFSTFHIQTPKELCTSTIFYKPCFSMPKTVGAMDQPHLSCSTMAQGPFCNPQGLPLHFSFGNYWFLTHTKLAHVYPTFFLKCWRQCGYKGSTYHIWWSCLKIANFVE